MLLLERMDEMFLTNEELEIILYWLDEATNERPKGHEDKLLENKILIHLSQDK